MWNKSSISILRRRPLVRAECPQCAAGCIGHMTVDELIERGLNTSASLSCPVCGRIHLNREEIDQLERQRVVDTARYRALCLQAEVCEPTRSVLGEG